MAVVTDVLLAGPATGIVFVATSILLLRQKKCFVVANLICRWSQVCHRHRVCRDKHTFVTTKEMCCRGKPHMPVVTDVPLAGPDTGIVFVATSILLLRQKKCFVVANLICLWSLTYHWQDLPQVSCLSRQTYFFHDKRNVLSWKTSYAGGH